METTRKIDAKAARRKRRLIREWITYAVICAFLAGVNALTTPHYWWVLWVMAGWGLGLILVLILELTNLSDADDAECSADGRPARPPPLFETFGQQPEIIRGEGCLVNTVKNGCQRTDTRICKEKSGMLKYIIIKTHCVWKREN